MEEFESKYEPRMVSYFDVLVYGGKKDKLSRELMSKIKEEGLTELVALPEISRADLMDILWEMGVDTDREVEERFCIHKPYCLAVSSDKEDTPKVYGKAYFGYLRQDTEFKKFCLENDIHF